LPLADVAAHPVEWEKVIRKLRAGVMPPVGEPRPGTDARLKLVGWLENELDAAAAAHPNPGRTEPFHRLNRAEYRNAVRDLLALDVDVAELLPADEASYGFDNIAGVSHKGLLFDHFRTLAAEAGAADPSGLARQLLILKEGAIVCAQVEGCREATAQAKAAAATLLDSALAH
jgi:hypothetical protein